MHGFGSTRLAVFWDGQQTPSTYGSSFPPNDHTVIKLRQNLRLASAKRHVKFQLDSYNITENFTIACVHNLFTQFAYLMRFRSSTTVLITYVVLFCFLLFEPLFNRSNFTFMLLTHPRRSRDPHVHMYVIFILKMALPAFQSKATLLTAWSKQRVCFSQPSNCHQCLEIKLFLSTNWF